MKDKGDLAEDFCYGFTFVLFVLKFIGVIHVSWAMVFAPIWLPVLSVSSVFVLLCLLKMFIEIIRALTER